MLAGIGATELVIVLAIVLLLFGAGRIGRIAGELGSGIRAFRDGMGEGQEPEPESEPSPTIN
jgi:sec-independent protein translocase protein TatA